MSNKLPSIPAYYQTYVDPKVNLENTPSIPCTFHNEVSGKSFSYSNTLNVWRCWGACHCGGDVIDLTPTPLSAHFSLQMQTRTYEFYSCQSLKCSFDFLTSLTYQLSHHSFIKFVLSI